MDLLAQRAATSPSSFLALINLLRPRLFSFSSLASFDSDPSSSSLSSEHLRVAEHFSKLKLTFLHLEAKAKFLAWMAREEAVPSVTSDDIDEAEAAIRAGKAHISDLKRRLDSAHSATHSLVTDLCDLWGAIEAEAVAMRGDWADDDWAELRALMADVGESDPVPLCSPGHLSALLAHHQSLHPPLAAALSTALAQEAATAGEIAAVEAEAARLEADEAAARGLLARHALVPAHVEWYEAGLDTLARLTGVRVGRREGSERSLWVHIEGQGGRTAEVEVDCVPGSLEFNGARLVSGDVDAQAWDDVLDYAMDTQDVGFMVREVQALLS